jgi:pimeloyl-ACP methyl ester carboxylesterase
LAFVALLAIIVAPGCHTPRITERACRGCPPAPSSALALHFATTPNLSADEIEYARLADQVERAAQATPQQLLAVADQADAIGCRLLRRDPAAAALPWFRDAAVYAVFALAVAAPAEPASPCRERAVARHNHAVEGLLHSAGCCASGGNPAWREQLAAAGIEAAPTTAEHDAVAPDELWVTNDFRVTNLEHVCRAGLGVPLISVKHFTNRTASPDRFFPEHQKLAVTAVLQPDGTLQGGVWRTLPVTLGLHDPAQESVIALSPTAYPAPMAADLTTPLAHQFIEGPLTQLAWGGLLRPESYAGVPGIFMGAPYVRGKIPVLFIHGLWSAPDAWMQMTNRLRADPLIRQRYQFWFAYYPTGAPLIASALRVRDALHELREAVDPERSDPALDQMVVVGHSLGGVLTKQMLQESGDVLERGLFTRPFAQVAMSPDSRAALTRFLHFTPESSIRRVVFVAAPHRGSNTANRLIGQLGTSLIRRPSDLAALHAEILELNGPCVLQPQFRRRPPSSIDNLEPDSPILKALSVLPIAPDVHCHSIVANLFPDGPPALWTDGVVSFESAHFERAESEVMIRHNHFATDTPEAAAEVRRILRLHVESIPDASPSTASGGRQPPVRFALASGSIAGGPQ